LGCRKRRATRGKVEDESSAKINGDGYLRITGAEPSEIECRALFHPVQYRGAFACSDERLTRIWMHSAYTHRLCQPDFVLDGIRRDRLPWVDNMILSAAVESYAFGDPELLRRTLTVMGRTAGTSDINGIVDYNFLWVIGHDALQRYFADTAYLRREWPRINEAGNLRALTSAATVLVRRAWRQRQRRCS